jgi:hypothetical protein
MPRYLLLTDDGDHFRLEDPDDYSIDAGDIHVTLTPDEVAEYKQACDVVAKFQTRFRTLVYMR